MRPFRSQMSAKINVAALHRSSLACCVKASNPLRAMNRFLFGGCLVIFFGCGARTESFTDLDGASGRLGAGGNSATAGRSFGGTSNVAGAINVAGTPSVGTGGATNIAGAPSKGGAPGFGGSGSFAGFPSKGGAPSFGGRPSVGGSSGRGGGGGSSGIEQTCQIIASNSCQQCQCTTCASQIVECISNFGCALILLCAEQTGCQGLACYTAQNCRSVIDQNGGLTGSAMQDVLSLYTCSFSSQNTCNCN